MQRTVKESSFTTGDSFVKNLKKYAIGLIIGAACAALFMLLFSFLLTVNSIPDSMTGAFGYISMAIAAFAAGFCATLLIKSKGLLNGAIMGVLFFVLHTIVSFAAGSGSVFSVKMLIFLVVEVALATLGGILSVNVRK